MAQEIVDIMTTNTYSPNNVGDMPLDIFSDYIQDTQGYEFPWVSMCIYNEDGVYLGTFEESIFHGSGMHEMGSFVRGGGYLNFGYYSSLHGNGYQIRCEEAIGDGSSGCNY